MASDRLPPLLSSFTDVLVKVAPDYQAQPINSFNLKTAIGEHARNYVTARYGSDDILDDPEHLGRRLPYIAMNRLSLDQIAKIRHSSCITLDMTVEDQFKEVPRFRIIEKIRNSMWRASYGRAPWNEIVDCYDGVRGFDLDHADFTLRLDYTTGWNEQGYSEFTETFLDGVLAYAVYYRGEHVMTIGFTLMDGYRLLIQQVQLTKRQGNRFLFKLPENRLEHIIGCFTRAFPDHNIYVVDGRDVAVKSQKAYENGVEKADRAILYAEDCLAKVTADKEQIYYRDQIARRQADRAMCSQRLNHIKTEIKRLRSFYRNTGRFNQGKPLKLREMRHYRICA